MIYGNDASTLLEADQVLVVEYRVDPYGNRIVVISPEAFEQLFSLLKRPGLDVISREIPNTSD